jgi:hypothetical protein
MKDNAEWEKHLVRAQDIKNSMDQAAAETPQASTYLKSTGYRQFPCAVFQDWASSAWQRQVDGVPEYSKGEGKFFITVYISPGLPEAIPPTFQVEGYGEVNGHAHTFTTYGLRLSEIESLLPPAENRVLAMWQAIQPVSEDTEH